MTLVKCDKKILQLFEKILVKKKKKKKVSIIFLQSYTPSRSRLTSTSCRQGLTLLTGIKATSSRVTRTGCRVARNEARNLRNEHATARKFSEVEQCSIHLISTMTDILITFEISSKNLKNGEIEIFLEKSTNTNTNNQYQSLFASLINKFRFLYTDFRICFA